MNYILHLIIYLNIYFIIATSLNMVVGYCGLMTLAHAGYFAIGSYTYALATLKLGLGFIPAMILGVAVASVLSFAISIPACRFKGDFFLLVSISVQALLFGLFYNWSTVGADFGTWANLTNGPFGISGIPKPDILGIKIDTIGGIAVISIIFGLGCIGISWLLLHSPWGRLLKAVRDDELAARGLGKDVYLAKMQVILIACGMVSIAGTIYASYVSYIHPASGSLDESILMLCMVIVGGAGNFRGPFVGALILLAIPEALRFAQLPATMAAELRLMAYGLLLIIMMHYRPQGLAGEYRIE